jgi:hypothetical protein
MLAVLVLVGVFLGMVGVRMDMFGEGASSELESFQVFANTQRARALRTGTEIRLEFQPEASTVRVRDNGEDRSQTFHFNFWSIDHAQPQTITLTPVGVFGPDEIRLVRDNQERVFELNRLVGFMPEESANP